MTTDKPTTSLANTIPDRDALLQFVDVDRLAVLFNDLDWTMEEEMRYYIDLVRCASTETTRLRALKQLAELRRAVMQANGMIVKASASTTGPDGSTAQISGSVLQELMRANPVPTPCPTPPQPQPATSLVDEGDLNAPTRDSTTADDTAVQEGSVSGAGYASAGSYPFGPLPDEADAAAPGPADPDPGAPADRTPAPAPTAPTAPVQATGDADSIPGLAG